MKISKISNTNFKGLWSANDRGVIGYIKSKDSLLTNREATYHPFSDETPEEIEQTMKEAEENMVYEGCYAQDFRPFIIVTKPKLGKKLNVTKEQYKEIEFMEKQSWPTSSPFPPCGYKNMPKENWPQEVEEIIDKI